ncbi:hypothetical protein GGF31_008455 [Allomyces arbusculus]|nr:hypothetical protein GGF31_008455 [Allomyces arbusculus]
MAYNHPPPPRAASAPPPDVLEPLDASTARTLVPWTVADTVSPFGPVVPRTRNLRYNATPLVLAVLAGNVRLVARLLHVLERDGTLADDIEAPDSLGRTPLIACVFGIDTLDITSENLPYVSQVHPHHAEIFDMLVKRLPPAEFERGHDCIHSISPFILASYLGKQQYVLKMLEHGANVDCVDTHNGTALMYAARDNHVGVVKTLLEFGASVTHRDKHGWSALNYGEKFDDIRALLEAANSLQPALQTPVPSLASAAPADAAAPRLPTPPAGDDATNDLHQVLTEYRRVVDSSRRSRRIALQWIDSWYDQVVRTLDFLDPADALPEQGPFDSGVALATDDRDLAESRDTIRAARVEFERVRNEAKSARPVSTIDGEAAHSPQGVSCERWEALAQDMHDKANDLASALAKRLELEKTRHRQSLDRGHADQVAALRAQVQAKDDQLAAVNRAKDEQLAAVQRDMAVARAHGAAGVAALLTPLRELIGADGSLEDELVVQGVLTQVRTLGTQVRALQDQNAQFASELDEKDARIQELMAQLQAAKPTGLAALGAMQANGSTSALPYPTPTTTPPQNSLSQPRAGNSTGLGQLYQMYGGSTASLSLRTPIGPSPLGTPRGTAQRQGPPTVNRAQPPQAMTTGPLTSPSHAHLAEAIRMAEAAVAPAGVTPRPGQPQQHAQQQQRAIPPARPRAASTASSVMGSSVVGSSIVGPNGFGTPTIPVTTAGSAAPGVMAYPQGQQTHPQPYPYSTANQAAAVRSSLASNASSTSHMQHLRATASMSNLRAASRIESLVVTLPAEDGDEYSEDFDPNAYDDDDEDEDGLSSDLASSAATGSHLSLTGSAAVGAAARARVAFPYAHPGMAMTHGNLPQQGPASLYNGRSNAMFAQSQPDLRLPTRPTGPTASTMLNSGLSRANSSNASGNGSGRQPRRPDLTELVTLTIDPLPTTIASAPRARPMTGASAASGMVISGPTLAAQHGWGPTPASPPQTGPFRAALAPARTGPSPKVMMSASSLEDDASGTKTLSDRLKSTFTKSVRKMKSLGDMKS